jgi:ubiquinone biosynthesis protein
VGLLGNLVLVLVFAWVVRALLGTREVTWPRLVLAVLVGTAAGAAAAYVLLIDVTAPLEEQIADYEARTSDVMALALPFQVLAAMLAVVVLELLLARPRRRGLRPVRPIRDLRRRAGMVARSARVGRILVRHGLAPALGLKRGEVPSRDPGELARRARTALEDAGGMFVKLGQLLATRPDLLPPEALEELGQLHAAARPLSREEAERAIRAELDGPMDTWFSEVDWTPLGSASIAQVHRATGNDGRHLVIKVRRPGLLEAVEVDLGIGVSFARLAERRTDWGATYEVGAIAEDFARALRTELDLRVEGRHAGEMAAAVAHRPAIRVPEVVAELTTERLLVMDQLVGTPLSALDDGRLTAEDARRLADELCESQVEAMLRGERFHGDPHPGNVLLLDDGGLGLIDFGVTGRLDAFERSSVFQMLLALRLGEPSLLYESLVAVGAIPATREPDEIERALARFMAAHLGPGLPAADALTDLLRLTTRLGFRLPPQTSTMFRSLATLAGTLEQLSPDYPLIDRVAELGGAELRERTSPSSVGELVQREWAQLGPLIRRAPRHLDRIATLIEHGGLAARIRLFTDATDIAVIERLLNRSLLAVVSLGLGLIAVLMLAVDAGPLLAGTEVRLLEALGWVGLFGASVLLLRTLLEILRPPPRDRR